jgi:hypothetical protein
VHPREDSHAILHLLAYRQRCAQDSVVANITVTARSRAIAVAIA